MYKSINVGKCLAVLLIFTFTLSGIFPAGIFPGIRAVEAAESGMVYNGGFETVTDAVYEYGTNNSYWKDNQADPWYIWTSSGTPEYTVVNDVYHEGNSSLRISNKTDARSAICQVINGVKAGETYKVGMWIKTENVVEMVLPRIQFIDGNGVKVGAIIYITDATIKGTTDWTYYEKAIAVPATAAGYKIEVFLGGTAVTTGTAWIDDVKAISTIPVKGFRLDKEIENILPGESAVLNYRFTPENAANKEIVWYSSDTAVVTVENGIVKAVDYGAANITAQTADGGYTDSCTILVGSLPGVTAPDVSEITNEDITLFGSVNATSNDGGTLSYGKLTDPANGTLIVNENGSWEYTPNEFYTGEDNFEIIVKSTNGGIGISKITVTVNSTHGAEFDVIRQNWFRRLTGGNDYDPSDPDIASYINSIANTAMARWDSMDRSENRTALWNDMVNAGSSWNIVWAFQELRTMALAYHLPSSPLYHNTALKNDIISSIDWMYANKYNEDTTQYDNWFHWEISGPQALNDLLVLMYSDLTSTQIDNYMRAIDHFVPYPAHRGTGETPSDFQTGANLTDRVMVVALRGVIGKNSAKVAEARDALSPVFLYVKSGDGFYEDGSFIQHTHVAYIGGYGASLLKSLSNVLNLLEESRFKISDPNLNNVWKWIPDSYEPFIYNGGMMDLVKGRSFGTEDHVTGRATIISLIRLLNVMPEDKALTVKKMVKEWVLSDSTFANYYDTAEFAIPEIVSLKEIIHNSSVERREELVMSRIFPYMANVVHLRPEFGFAVSMFSNTITAFENGNNQNREGWYQGTGMTYIYNNDLTQYTNIGRTINMYRLPGTTTDGSKGNLVGWKKYPNPQKWVGGSTVNNLYSSIGMDFSMSENTGASLKGKKSWFMFGDKIVALGSGITSTDNRNVETIVENRRLNSSGDNILTVNGTAYHKSQDWSNTFNGVNWAHLQGNVSGADIGYYFPESPDIYGLREKKEGTVKVFPAADAYVADGKYANNNYGKANVTVVRSNGTGYNYESFYKFDLSNIEGNITSAKLRLYPTGVYNPEVNYAEMVSNTWDEFTITWNNKPASTGNVVGSWDPVKGVWVAVDVTEGAQAAVDSEDKNISFRVFPDSIYNSNPTDTANYASRENTSATLRPYLEVVTDITTDRYQSLAFEHGTNPANADYAYAILPGKTAEEMAGYANDPDIAILENSTDAHAVMDKTLNAVGVNFWNDIVKTIALDGEAFITSDKAASVTVLENGNELDIAVSDPTRSNAGIINIEINKQVVGIKDVDPDIKITQLSPTIKMEVNVNEAEGKSLQVKFNIFSSDAALSDLKYESQRNSFQTVPGFVYNKYDYTVEMPYGTPFVPQVTVAEAVYAKAEITQADLLPGMAVIKVTAQDGVTVQEYRVSFTVASNGEETDEVEEEPVKPDNDQQEYRDIRDALKEYKDAKPEDRAELLEKALDKIEKALDLAYTIEGKFVEKIETQSETIVAVKKEAIESFMAKLTETKQPLNAYLRNAGVENAVDLDRKEVKLEIKNRVKQEMKIIIPSGFFRIIDGQKFALFVDTEGLDFRIPPAAVNLEDEAEQVQFAVKKVDEKGVETGNGLTVAGDVLDFGITVIEGEASKQVENFLEKITVRIIYKRNGIDEDKLGVYRYDPVAGLWEYIGGKVNNEDNMVEFTTSHFGIYSVMEYNKTFSDIVNHWGKNDIEIMAAKHIVVGKDEANFAPEDKLTRAEFATAIVRAFGLDLVRYGNTFNDVSAGKWYADVIQTIANKGIIKGDGENFRPEDTITREEMAALMIRAYRLFSEEAPIAEDIGGKFKDDDHISSWAKEDVRSACGMGLIKGTGDDTFNPGASATRAEATVIIKRLLEKMQ